MSSEAEIDAEVLAWSRDHLRPWQHEAFRRLLHRGSLTEEDKKQIFERALLDHSLKTADSPLPDVTLKDSDLPTRGRAVYRIALVALKGLKNVNALKPGESLSFGKQLTVIFGENASGKSGYVRAMKKACTAKDIEEILPDVFARSVPQGPATATFEIEENGTVREEHWEDGKTSPAALRRFAVFDCKCARVYVNKSNQLSFSPWIFEVMERLGSVTKDVKDRISGLASDLAPKTDALQPLVDQTAVGRLLATLSHNTDPATITGLASWTGQDEGILAAKQTELNKLKLSSPQALRDSLSAEKRRIGIIQRHLTALEEGISDAKLRELRRAASEYETYDQAAKAAAQLAFGDAEIKGIGGPAWQELILAAQKFSTQAAYPGEPFPATVEGARCVLCLQPLSAEASTRLKRFWDFLHEEVSSKRDRAKENFDALLEALGQLPRSTPAEITAIEDSVLPSNRGVLDQAKLYFAAAAQRMLAIQGAVKTANWDTMPGVPPSLSRACQAAHEAIDIELGMVKQDVQVEAAIQTLSQEIRELDARKRLSGSVQFVLRHLNALKASTRAQRVADDISTYSISMKARDLHTKYVTEAYKDSVHRELQALSGRRVKVGIGERSERGKVLHSVTVDGASAPVGPEQVFSEGERTAVSVACFLADLGPVEETSGIILDDPLTSLDYVVREGLAKRLVAEAKNRQVIIFTHDLPFYCELRAEAEIQRVDVVVHQIESVGPAVGLVSSSSNEPWDATKVGQRYEHLDKLAKEAEAAGASGQPRPYEEKLQLFYSRLRSTWERSVEELLFNQAVQRFDRAVKPQRLTEVAADDEAITAVITAWDRCSRIIEAHDHAVAARGPLPTPDDIKTDLKALKDFVDKQKEKKRQAGQRLVHLKS